jgi:hypothetical protein
LIDCLDGQREQGEGGRAYGIRGGAAVQRKEGGKKKGRGETGADMWDPPVGTAVEKKREGGEAVGRRGKLGWAAWAERVGCWFLFFFLFFFKLHFQIHFQLKFKSNFCKLFSNIL